MIWFNTYNNTRAVLVLVIAYLLIAGTVGLAQTGGDFKVLWSSVGIGGQNSGGPYSQRGSFQMTDANELSGGGFTASEESAVQINCIVGFRQFALFAEHWLQSSCDDINNFCDGADINQLDGVDYVDLGLFADEWMRFCPGHWLLDR